MAEVELGREDKAPSCIESFARSNIGSIGIILVFILIDQAGAQLNMTLS